MVAPWSSNWAGSLPNDLSTVFPATLNKPGDEAEPCTITCDLKLQQHPLAAGSQLLLCSNARMVEVSVARPGDTSTSYLQTVRCQPLQGEQHNYQAIIPLQGAVGASCLQLKLLSLQGDKTACTIHQLQFQQQEQPAHHAPAAAAEVRQSTSSTSGLQHEQQHEQQQQLPGADAAPQLTAAAAAAASPGQQPSLSQLEELRLLIQQLHTPGSAEGGGPPPAVPESLQLLHSKATAVPQPGAGTAIKSLSAHIAQGMLFQAAQERARLQQEQQQEQQQHEQQQPQGSQQYQQVNVSEGGGRGHTQPCQQQTDSMQPLPAPSSLAAASAPGQSPPWQACLSVLQRLEVKVDQLAAGVTAGLQQLDRRLAKLEAACGAGAASHSQTGNPGSQQSLEDPVM